MYLSLLLSVMTLCFGLTSLLPSIPHLNLVLFLFVFFLLCLELFLYGKLNLIGFTLSMYYFHFKTGAMLAESLAR